MDSMNLEIFKEKTRGKELIISNKLQRANWEKIVSYLHDNDIYKLQCLLIVINNDNIESNPIAIVKYDIAMKNIYNEDKYYLNTKKDRDRLIIMHHILYIIYNRIELYLRYDKLLNILIHDNNYEIIIDNNGNRYFQMTSDYYNNKVVVPERLLDLSRYEHCKKYINLHVLTLVNANAYCTHFKTEANDFNIDFYRLATSPKATTARAQSRESMLEGVRKRVNIIDCARAFRGTFDQLLHNNATQYVYEYHSHAKQARDNNKIIKFILNKKIQRSNTNILNNRSINYKCRLYYYFNHNYQNHYYNYKQVSMSQLDKDNKDIDKELENIGLAYHKKRYGNTNKVVVMRSKRSPLTAVQADGNNNNESTPTSTKAATADAVVDNTSTGASIKAETQSNVAHSSKATATERIDLNKYFQATKTTTKNILDPSTIKMDLSVSTVANTSTGNTNNKNHTEETAMDMIEKSITKKKDLITKWHVEISRIMNITAKLLRTLNKYELVKTIIVKDVATNAKSLDREKFDEEFQKKLADMYSKEFIISTRLGAIKTAWVAGIRYKQKDHFLSIGSKGKAYTDRMDNSNEGWTCIMKEIITLGKSMLIRDGEKIEASFDRASNMEIFVTNHCAKKLFVMIRRIVVSMEKFIHEHESVNSIKFRCRNEALMNLKFFGGNNKAPSETEEIDMYSMSRDRKLLLLEICTKKDYMSTQKVGTIASDMYIQKNIDTEVLKFVKMISLKMRELFTELSQDWHTLLYSHLVWHAFSLGHQVQCAYSFGHRVWHVFLSGHRVWHVFSVDHQVWRAFSLSHLVQCAFSSSHLVWCVSLYHYSVWQTACYLSLILSHILSHHEKSMIQWICLLAHYIEYATAFLKTIKQRPIKSNRWDSKTMMLLCETPNGSKRYTRKNWKRKGKNSIHRGNIRIFRVVNFDAKRFENYNEAITIKIEKEDYEIIVITNANKQWINDWQIRGWFVVWLEKEDIAIIGNADDINIKEENGCLLLGKGSNTVAITGFNLPSATKGVHNSKSIHDIMDDKLEEALERIKEYDMAIMIGQTETRDMRWSLNDRTVDSCRVNVIQKWERRNRIMQLIEGDKQNPVRRPGRQKPSTHKAGWTKRVSTIAWKTTDIEGIDTTRMQVCEFIMDDDNVNGDDVLKEKENDESSNRDNITAIAKNTISTKRIIDPESTVRILQADASRAKIVMRRIKNVVNKNEYDILIITRPDPEELKEWKLQWEVVEGKDTAILLINKYMCWKIVENKHRKLGAAIDLMSQGKICRLRTISLEPRNKKESYTKKAARLDRRILAIDSEDNSNTDRVLVGNIGVRCTKWSGHTSRWEEQIGSDFIDNRQDNGMQAIGNNEKKNNRNFVFSSTNVLIENWQVLKKGGIKAIEYELADFKDESRTCSLNGSPAWHSEMDSDIETIESRWKESRIKKDKEIRVLQINGDNSRKVSNELLEYIINEAIDIVLISEPHIYKGNKLNLPGRMILSKKDARGRTMAAILIVNKTLNVIDRQDLAEKEFCITTIGRLNETISIISVYLNPIRSNIMKNKELANKARQLQETFSNLEKAIKTLDGKVIIAGDFNIKLPEWNKDGKTSPRIIIEKMREFYYSNELIFQNERYVPTFENKNKEGCSTIDLTFTNKEDIITGWNIHEDETHISVSDHKYIRWNIQKKDEYTSQARKPRFKIIDDEHRSIIHRIQDEDYSHITGNMDILYDGADKYTIDRLVHDLTAAIQNTMKKSLEIYELQVTNETSKKILHDGNNDHPIEMQTEKSDRKRRPKKKIKGQQDKGKRHARFWDKRMQQHKNKFMEAKNEYRKDLRRYRRNEKRGITEGQEEILAKRDEIIKIERLYKKELEEARTRKFREKCDIRENSNAFNQVYRIAFEKYNRESALTNMQHPTKGMLTRPEDIMQYMMENSFPDDKLEEDTERQMKRRQRVRDLDEIEYTKWTGKPLGTETLHQVTEHDVDESQYEGITELGEPQGPPTVDQVIDAIIRSSSGKAPGADEIMTEVIKVQKRVIAPIITKIIEKCLTIGYFPIEWKKANVVMIPKPGKSQQIAAGWRPICLLNVLAKIMDKIMIERVLDHVAKTGNFNPNQYGFSPRKSTVHAVWDAEKTIIEKRNEHGYVACLFLDITGAFDTAWHITLMEKLRGSKCPKDWYYLINNYLKERQATYSRDGTTIRKITNRGCPQGSSSGPGIWNLVYDGMLELNQQFDWSRFQAYADDGLIIVWADDKQELVRRCDTVIKSVFEWGKQNKLKFSPEKTEILAVFRKKDKKDYTPASQYKNLELTIGGVTQKSKEVVRYLGIQMDRELNYKQHMDIAMAKSTRAMRMLTAMARKDWGLSPGVMRVIYKVAVETLITYGAAIWYKKLENKVRLRKLKRWHTGLVQKVARTMSSVAGEDAAFVADLMPIEHRITELAETWKLKNLAGYELKNEEEKVILDSVSINKRGNQTSEHIEYKCKEWAEGMSLQQGKSKVFIMAKIETEEDEETGKQTKRGWQVTQRYYKGNKRGRTTRQYKLNKKKEDTIHKVTHYEILANAIHDAILEKRQQRVRATDKLKLRICIIDEELLNGTCGDINAINILYLAVKKARDWGIELKWTVITGANEKLKDKWWKKLHKDHGKGKCKKTVILRDNSVFIESLQMNKWSLEHAKLDVGAHSRYLLGSAIERRRLKHINPTYEMTQVYTGHSKIASHMAKLSQDTSEFCPGCWEEEETLGHFLFECPVWIEHRTEMSKWLEANKQLWQSDGIRDEGFEDEDEREEDNAEERSEAVNEDYELDEMVKILEDKTGEQVSTRYRRELDRLWGITAKKKTKEYHAKQYMRKLRTLIRDKEGHEILERYVLKTKRLHLFTIGIDGRNKRAIQRYTPKGYKQSLYLARREGSKSMGKGTRGRYCTSQPIEVIIGGRTQSGTHKGHYMTQPDTMGETIIQEAAARFEAMLRTSFPWLTQPDPITTLVQDSIGTNADDMFNTPSAPIDTPIWGGIEHEDTNEDINRVQNIDKSTFPTFTKGRGMTLADTLRQQQVKIDGENPLKQIDTPIWGSIEYEEVNDNTEWGHNIDKPNFPTFTKGRGITLADILRQQQANLNGENPLEQADTPVRKNTNNAEMGLPDTHQKQQSKLSGTNWSTHKDTSTVDTRCDDSINDDDLDLGQFDWMYEMDLDSLQNTENNDSINDDDHLDWMHEMELDSSQNTEDNGTLVHQEEYPLSQNLSGNSTEDKVADINSNKPGKYAPGTT